MPNWASFYSTRPLVFAHRGASGSAPENTLAAFRAAVDAGADGIELDVTRCGSGEVVVIHDDTVDRTTDGAGAVSSMPLDHLRALDAGAWYGPQFAGERVPLLAEVLDAVGGSLRINIEVKGRALRGDGIEAAIATLVRERGLQQTVLISSFSPAALRRMGAVAPELQRGFLFLTRATILPAPVWARWWASAHALHPSIAGLDEMWVRRAKERGYRVNVWTVNEPDAMRRMAMWDVDGIITDHPVRLRALLDEIGGAGHG